jgi:hypothetical protein
MGEGELDPAKRDLGLELNGYWERLIRIDGAGKRVRFDLGRGTMGESRSGPG